METGVLVSIRTHLLGDSLKIQSKKLVIGSKTCDKMSTTPSLKAHYVLGA